MHPRNQGYLNVAKEFDRVIKLALSETVVTPKLPSTFSMLPGLNNGSKPLEGLRELPDEEFARLVVTRAGRTLGIEVATPRNKVERREIEENLEKVSNKADFLPSSFLEVGVERAQAVCRIVVNSPLGKGFGSGFLIGTRDFVMTNNHVLPNKRSAKSSLIEFDYDQDTIEYNVSLQPDKFFITSKELDFTIVACDSSTLPRSVRPIEIPTERHLITRKERVNIIQHPQGRRKEIAIHDNTVSYIYDKAIRYSADTEEGSSGAPVFNNSWQLCALHHAGWKNIDGSATNEGINLNSITDYLRRHMAGDNHTYIQAIMEGDQLKPKMDEVSRSESSLGELTINLSKISDKVIINVGE